MASEDVMQEFTVGGKRYRMSHSQVIHKMLGVVPEPARKYVVEIDGKRYPVKQAVSRSLGAPRAAFQTQEAYRVLAKLGFPITEERAA